MPRATSPSASNIFEEEKRKKNRDWIDVPWSEFQLSSRDNPFYLRGVFEKKLRAERSVESVQCSPPPGSGRTIAARRGHLLMFTCGGRSFRSVFKLYTSRSTKKTERRKRLDQNMRKNNKPSNAGHHTQGESWAKTHPVILQCSISVLRERQVIPQTIDVKMVVFRCPQTAW
jgi:hypothetical protein